MVRMDSDQTVPDSEFQGTTFHDEHESTCDLDTHCPECGQFYVPRPLIVAAGTIMFMGAYSLRLGLASQAAAISAGLFLILAFFFVSVLRSRSYELGILFTSAVGLGNMTVNAAASPAAMLWDRRRFIFVANAASMDVAWVVAALSGGASASPMGARACVTSWPAESFNATTT